MNTNDLRSIIELALLAAGSDKIRIVILEKDDLMNNYALYHIAFPIDDEVGHRLIPFCTKTQSTEYKLFQFSWNGIFYRNACIQDIIEGEKNDLCVILCGMVFDER